MAIAKEQVRQIISENNLTNVGDVYSLLRDSFKDILQELIFPADRHVIQRVYLPGGNGANLNAIIQTLKPV